MTRVYVCPLCHSGALRPGKCGCGGTLLPARAGRRSKYGATPVVVDGIRFASKREAERHAVLLQLQRAGVIAKLERQTRFVLHAAGGEKVGVYRADSSYIDVASGRVVVEDAKGFATPLYRWKKRHMKAEYGIEVKEV